MSKSLNIWFEKNRKILEYSVKLYDYSYYYYYIWLLLLYGITLTDYMSNSVDSYGVLNKFLRQYNSMYHIFKFPSREINNKLLKKYL